MLIPAKTPRNALACFGFSSLPSEEKAASLTEIMQHLQTEGKISSVVFRYPQIKAGEENAFNYASFSFVIFSAIAYLIVTELKFLSEQKMLFLFFALIELVMSGIFLPSYGNYNEYNHSRKNCEKWLESKINNDFLSSLRTVEYDHVGFFSVEKLLVNNGLAAKVDLYELPKQFKNALKKSK